MVRQAVLVVVAIASRVPVGTASAQAPPPTRWCKAGDAHPSSDPGRCTGCRSRDRVAPSSSRGETKATRDQSPLDDSVHALDPEALRALSELVGGDSEALADLASAFLGEAPERLAELRAGADRGDAALAGRAAHTLKANGLTFGAIELASLCRRLEIAARNQELAANRELIDRLDTEWAHVRPALTALRDGAQP